MRRAWLALAALLLAASPAAANDFPTPARAEFVFVCMQSNGQVNELMLHRCSCQLDAIAERISYEEYVHAETMLRLRFVPGERTAGIRETSIAVAAIDKLKAAQAEAEIQCF